MEWPVCLSVLNSQTDFLFAQNVILVSYFQILKNHLDCNLYDTSFNLPFVFGNKMYQALDFTNCIAKLTPDNLSVSCKKVCQNLGISSISPVFESDWLFLERSMNFYQEELGQIYFKKNTTSYNPMLSLQRMNSQNVTIQFFQIANKTQNRLSKQQFISPPSKLIDEEPFTKDLRAYDPNADEGLPTDKNSTVQQFMYLQNNASWQPFESGSTNKPGQICLSVSHIH